jgi:hypothetical protein
MSSRPRPLDDLEGMLIEEYADRTMTMENIYKEHSVGRPYISKHYKQVLTKLENEGTIEVTDPLGKKRLGFPERLIVRFPKGAS